MKRLFAATCFLGATATVPAYADGSGQIYVGLDVIDIKAPAYCNGVPATVNNTQVSCHDNFTAQRIALGIQPIKGWGAEFSYAHDALGILGPNNSDCVAFCGFYDTRVSASVAQLSGTYTFPVNRIVSLNGKIGVARTMYKGSAITTQGGNAITIQPAAGLGIQLNLFRKFALRAQYDDLGTAGNNATGRSKLQSISIGWLYKF